MTRYQNQQGIGVTGQQLTMSRQHHLVFAVMGTGRDPHRSFQCPPLPAQFNSAFQQLRVDGQVELDRTGYFDGFVPGAQVAQALRLGFGLHREQAHLGQHRLGQPGEPAIAPGRTLGQPRIGQCHGDPALGALMDMVGPQFGFHDHRQFRLDPIEEAPGSARQVVRQITVLDARLIGEQCMDAFRTGRRHAGHGDRQIRITRQQGADHRRGRNAFAHRHGVHPDAARFHRRHSVGKALADTPGISRRLARAQPKPNRYQWQPQIKQRGVESSIHGGGVYRLFSPIACKCTAKRSASQRAAGPSGSSRRHTSSTTRAGGVHSLTSSTIWF